MKESTRKLLAKLWEENNKPQPLVEMPLVMPSHCYIRPSGSDSVDIVDSIPSTTKYQTGNHGILKSLEGWEWSIDLRQWKPCPRNA